MRGRQEPRLSNVPDGVVHPDLEAALELAAAAGIVLDPWQALVFRGACRRRGGGWAAKRVGLCCPRQNGKNAILEVRQLAGLFIFNERLQRHTAHLTDTANTAFKRLVEILDENDWLMSEVKHVWRANGKEAIELKNGNAIEFRTRTARSGRGPSPNTIYFDEAMELSEASIAAMVPSVAAKSMSAAPPQFWYTGSAVDQAEHDCAVFTRVRNLGLAGNDETAWFEWSVEAASPDEVRGAADPEQWAIANPGMNIRISQDHIASELEGEMSMRSFCVERLGAGDWPNLDEDGSVISVEKWMRLADGQSEIAGRPVLCFDVNPNRSYGAICAAGRRADEMVHVEVVDHRPGTGWIVDRLVELRAKHRPVAILCDSISPASSLISELESRGVTVEPVNSTEHAQACGTFFDAVEDEKLRHLGTSELISALRGAAKRPLGESWAWSRKNSSVDITPLVACTLAHWEAANKAAKFAAVAFG